MTTTHRPRLVLSIVSGTVAAVLLAGCGSAPERPAPATAVHGVTDSGASAAPIPSAGGEVPASPDQTGTPTTAAEAATAAADIGPSLADIDRALADLDTRLNDADHDVATPEGDIR